MGSIFAALHNAAGTMGVVQKGIRVVQNNVANISTPGYARQSQILIARNFSSDMGLAGGVMSGGVSDSRSEFAEQSVRLQMEHQGRSSKMVDRLAQIERVLGIGETQGIPKAINDLFQAFSVLTVSPNDSSARQVVLDRAAETAQAFHTTSDRLVENRNATAQDVLNTINRINELGEHLSQINIKIREDAKNRTDSGVQAELHNTLEELAKLTNATTLFQDDGSVGIYLGGENLFVLGANTYPISAIQSGSELHVAGLNGTDITSTLTRGELGGVLELHNKTLTGFETDLDKLASALADTVNGTLLQGIDSSGNTPLVDLFGYDPMFGAARTLAANSMAPADLAVASMGAPGGNGNALVLAGLSSEKLAALDGFSFSGFYGSLAAGVGRKLATAQESATTQEQLVLQARDLRDQLSKVNLDEEAVILLEFQRAYQANAEMVRTLNEMTETTLSLLR